MSTSLLLLFVPESSDILFPSQAQKAPARVLITGAAGQIAYSLVFMVARGDMLGADQPVIPNLSS